MDRTVQGSCWACGLGQLRLRGLDGVLALAERYRGWFGEDWGRNGRELARIAYALLKNEVEFDPKQHAVA